MTAISAVIPGLTPQAYRAHGLHAPERVWPETNCYVDVWIEVLHALGLEPLAALAFTVAQDFEGDHFTFFKFPPEDLEKLFGLSVQELAIYDTLEAQVVTQVRRGRMPLVEVDSFFLPDTKGIAYQAEHTKTTIGVNSIDVSNRRLDYFHGPGYFTAEGSDYDGLFRRSEDVASWDEVLFPYVEFIKIDRDFTAPPFSDAAIALLRHHLGKRPRSNPVHAFHAELARSAEFLGDKPPEFFHKYAFNTARQFGANFEVLSSHLGWLQARRESGLSTAIEKAREIATTAKTFQFQLARAFARKRFGGLEPLIEKMAASHDAVMSELCAKLL
jgi:Domain of unknown function (DUF1839)